MSNPHTERALLLLQQRRPELAIQEARQALAQDVNDPQAHCVLAISLLELNQYDEAAAHAAYAVQCAPDMPFCHTAVAEVCFQRNDLGGAEFAIREAIRLDPQYAYGFAFLAKVCYAQRRWAECQQAAETGLQLDPESNDCTNYRAMALVKQGNPHIAGQVIQQALERDPENWASHANLGWALLEQGDVTKAQQHFREALRLNPESEWARQGMLEALKARNPLYRLILWYFLWVAKLSAQAQWLVLLGGYFGNRALRTFGRMNPQWAWIVQPLLIAYLVFVLMTWLATPLCNLTLRLHPFGRFVLTRRETAQANVVGVWVAFALLFLVLGFTTPWPGMLMTAALFGLTLPAVTSTFDCDAGWPRAARSRSLEPRSSSRTRRGPDTRTGPRP